MVWTTAVADAPISPPVLAGEHAVVALRSGDVVGIRLTDGREAWTAKVAAAGRIAGTETLVVVPVAGALLGLDAATGQLQWTRETKPLTAAPLARGGWVIVAAGEELTALRAESGTEVWTARLAGMNTRSTIDGDALYVPVGDGRLFALDLTSGMVRWERRVGANPTEPFVFGDRIYFGANDKEFVCARIADGSDDWRFVVGASVIGTAAADESLVYAVSMDNLLRAFRRSNGAREWMKDVGYRPTAGPVVAAGTVSVPGRTATLRALDPATRTAVAELKLPDAAVTPFVLDPPQSGRPGRLAVVAHSLGRPWLLVLANEAPPALTVTPLGALPGTPLPLPRMPL